MQISKPLFTSLLCFSCLFAESERIEEQLEETYDYFYDKGEFDEEMTPLDQQDFEETLEHKQPQTFPVQGKEEFVVNLKNPIFSGGVISTEEGGIIESSDIRIQAQKIVYTNKIENGKRVQKVEAQGDLLMDYAGRSFVGERLEFDFTTKSGVLWKGKTYVDAWFVGGEKIELRSDGSYYMYNAFITTCESQDNTWEISSSRIKITKDQWLSAKNIRFRFDRIPVFWFPTFKSNLKLFTDSPIKYKVLWDKGLGPRASLRYRLFSWKHVNLYTRLDYRIKRGFGAALETDYHSTSERTLFQAKAYGANDKSVSDERGPKRYRLQGLFDHKNRNQKTQVYLSYDKMSDNKMPQDFKNDDFEINTEKRTRLLIDHRERNVAARLSFQPRVNIFQTVNQELPLVMVNVRPLEIGNSGIISENYANAAVLNYAFAPPLHHHLRNTHAKRLETRNHIYRPFHMGPVTVTPQIGFIGIYYSNNPHRHDIGQALGSYGGEINTHLIRNYSSCTHIVEPYIRYDGITNTTIGINDHFYFSIDDGYHELNQMRVGVRNTLFSYKFSSFMPTFNFDIYTYGFFDSRTYKRTFPKGYFDFALSRPSFGLYTTFCWNLEEQVLDFSNTRFDWTINEDFAFGIEFRHRSKFDWRKGDHDNFVLDVSRSIHDLIHSPISDGRDTFLSRWQVRLAPKWTCTIESHHGWGRRNEPRYNAAKVELNTLLTCNWKLRVSYTHTPNDDRFSGGFSLVK